MARVRVVKPNTRIVLGSRRTNTPTASIRRSIKATSSRGAK